MAKSKSRGFTLIELMVVMFIIAIIIAVAVVALGDMGRSRKAKYIAEEIQTAIQSAQQTAIIQPTTIVFRLKNDSYQFRELKMISTANGNLEYHWQTLQDSIENNNQLPFYIYARFNGKENSIIINSSGAISAFTLDIGVKGESRYYQLRSNGSGHIALLSKDSEAS